MLSVLLFSMSVSSFDCIFYSLDCLAIWWKKSCCSGIWCGARPQTQVGRFQNSRIWALLVAHKLNVLSQIQVNALHGAWKIQDVEWCRWWDTISSKLRGRISCRAWDFPDDQQKCLQRETVHFDWSFILTWKQSARCVTPGHRITGRNVLPWCRIEMSTGKWVGALWAWALGLTSYFQPWRPPRRHRSLVMVVVSCQVPRLRRETRLNLGSLNASAKGGSSSNWEPNWRTKAEVSMYCCPVCVETAAIIPGRRKATNHRHLPLRIVLKQFSHWHTWRI